MRAQWVTAIAAVVLCVMCLTPIANAASDDDFSLSVAPYTWLAGVSGTIGVKGIKADVDKTFFDLLDDADTIEGLFGRVEGHYGRFGFYADGGYTRLGVDKISGPFGRAKIDFTQDIGIIDFGMMYRLIQSAGDDSRFSLDATAGARYWTMGVEVSSANFPSQSGGIAWIDPTVGLRGTLDLGRHLEVVLGGDIGGFDAASQFTWSAICTIGYTFRIGKVDSSVFAGYKAIGDDYSSGGFTWDAILHGPVIGMQFTF